MPHPYLANTSGSFEKRMNQANVRAGSASGMPNYPHMDRERQGLIRQAEAKRPLRRSEYINLYGYQAWLDYCDQHGVDPHGSKWADAHTHKLSSIGGPPEPRPRPEPESESKPKSEPESKQKEEDSPESESDES